MSNDNQSYVERLAKLIYWIIVITAVSYAALIIAAVIAGFIAGIMGL